MKFKNKLLSILLFPLLISGCSFSSSGHTHTYIVKQAKEATCEQAGNIKYLYCEECTVYFDMNKNEITKASTIIPALGHSFDSIEVSGNFKRNYYVGESFDTTDMHVYKVCSREGCDKHEEVTEYTLSYPNIDQTTFNDGDEEVTVSYNGMSTKIEITVDKHNNEILGMLDSYDVYCHNGIDESSISCLAGDISIKYFTDEACLNEISSSEIVGNSIYYVKAETINVPIDYKSISKIATINATHDIKIVGSINKVGYVTKTCSYCHSSTTTLMTSKDIDLSIKTNYGMNADSLTSGSNEGNSGVSNTPFWAVDEDLQTKTIYLPKINYRLYKSVSFVWKSSSNSAAIMSLGLVKDDDLLTYKNHGTNPYGKINVTCSGTRLNIELICNDGYKKSMSIEDAGIANGNDPLRLFFTSSLYRSFYLNSVSLEQLDNAKQLTMKVDGVDAPNYEDGRGIEITAYCTPKLTEDNYDTVLQDLRDCGFSKIWPLLDGRGSSYSTNFANALINFANADSSQKQNKLEILYTAIDTLCSQIKTSNMFNIKKANEYGLSYSVFNEGIYDMPGYIKNNDISITVNEYKDIMKRFYSNMTYLGMIGSTGLTYTDEPSTDNLDYVKAAVEAYYEMGLEGEPYINLLPVNGFSTKSKFEEHISAYMEKVYPYINYLSYDLYPYLRGGTILEDHLYNLSYTANAIKNTNSSGELRTFIYSVENTNSHDPITTKEQLLFQANAALAYGSKEISYFCYSSNTDTNELTHCLVNGTNYTKSDLYYEAQEANKYINNIGKVFASFDWQGTMKAGSCTEFNKATNWSNSCLSLSCVSTSNDPLLVGCFTNGDNDAYLAMNYADSRTNYNSSSMTLNFNQTYKYVLVYSGTEKHVYSINNNKYTFDLNPAEACFVIPFNL